MIGLPSEKIPKSEFFQKFGLTTTSQSTYRSQGVWLGDVVELKLSFDKAGDCDAVQLTLPESLLTHQVLGKLPRDFLFSLLVSCGEEESTFSKSPWFVDFPGQPLELGLNQISVAIKQGQAVFSIAKKKKGFWSRFTSS